MQDTPRPTEGELHQLRKVIAKWPRYELREEPSCEELRDNHLHGDMHMQSLWDGGPQELCRDWTKAISRIIKSER